MKMWKCKQELYALIIAYWENHPYATMEQIGVEFGKSKQRISQIIREYGDQGNEVV